jgi:hypothetical protein
VTWFRSQVYTGPKILNKESDQETIQLGGTCEEVLLTAVVLDADNNIETVVIDLTTLNGDPAQTMYDDGTHGDVTVGDGIYSYRATVCLDAGSGTKTLTITATDGDSQSSQSQIELEAAVPGEIIWDNGGADSNWSTPENWNPDGVPGPGNRVAFNNLSSTDCVVDVSTIDVAALSLNYGYTGTVTLSAASMGSKELTITGNLTVNSGTLLCVGDTTAINEVSGGSVGNPHGEGIIINASNITVGVSGKISANGQGFLSNHGPGAGEYANDQGAGGSYGGIGGDGVAAAHGSTYGSVSEPTALGSGGAYNWSGVDTYGGTGAGAIKLVVSNTLKNNGTISANGANYTGGRAGGGAGGSVWIIAPTLAGSGSITADGGIGQATEGGGGAGGRIALQWTSKSYDGIIRAKGGSGWHAGHHGTIWVPSDKWNELWNATYHVNGSIALAPGDYSIAELYLDSNVTLECQADNDGDPVNGSGVTITSTNINIPATAAISADGLGFRSNEGPGVGEPISDQGAGGSHGGIGGDGIAAAHGSTYGSVSAPTALGSGGAYNWSGSTTLGGTGAGAIKLVVGNTLTVDGTVSADGDRYIGGRTGGGAGGSVWIIAPTLTGSGSITADGGFGYATEGGGGGGGRIALQWTTRIFDGTIRAKGGTGWLSGHHGTIWVPADKWNELWNSTYHVNGSIALAPGEYSIAELYLDDNVTLECQADNDGDPVEGTGVIINATNINIPATAAISADGLGFRSNEGPGVGESISDQGAGGSHGGIGGDGISAAHGSTYGFVSEPTALGSGGAHNWGGFDTWGGAGAGAIKLVVSNTLTVDGTVSADGLRYIGDRTGGGSGGSVWIIAPTLTGSGSITADGGIGYATEGGGGGGGRIALQWATRTFDGTIRAKGGTGWLSGHHGTIWVPSDKWDQLWNDTYHVNGDIALAPGEYTIYELNIDSGVTLECQGDNDGDPVEGTGVIINATNINIPATAAISADGLGFRSNEGPGAGTFISDQGAGGSHGGMGGDGVSAPAASTYGSESAPISLGSGGAYNWSGFDTYGGTGAGAIKLVVSDTLTVDGTVSANGVRYIGGHAGGGAGGSIWIITDILVGAGSIAADGGIGYASDGGGGGGGRVAVYYNTDSSSLSGSTTVSGGTGVDNGEPGTLVW